MNFRSLLFFTALALGGCNSIPIDVGTKEPVKVSIAMKVDVYQHADPNGPKKPAPPPSADIATSRRVRMGEVQILKNSRLIGENHAGYLEVRTVPPGEYGDYVRLTVDAENSDRGRLIEKLAKERNRSACCLSACETGTFFSFASFSISRARSLFSASTVVFT